MLQTKEVESFDLKQFSEMYKTIKGLNVNMDFKYSIVSERNNSTRTRDYLKLEVVNKDNNKVYYSETLNLKTIEELANENNIMVSSLVVDRWESLREIDLFEKVKEFDRFLMLMFIDKWIKAESPTTGLEDKITLMERMKEWKEKMDMDRTKPINPPPFLPHRPYEPYRSPFNYMCQ